MDNLFISEEKKLRLRLLFVYVFISLVVAILIFNLIRLQIVEGNENLLLSSSIKTSKSIIYAPRGLIYDSNGDTVVKNIPSYRLVVDISEYQRENQEKIINTLVEILGEDRNTIKEELISKIYKKDKKTKVDLAEVTLITNLSRDNVISVESRKSELKGLFVDERTTRDYPEGELMSHVTGYIREVSENELETGKYVLGDNIGATGLELYYDETLRGENGVRFTETDRDNVTVRELYPFEALAGDSLQLTIDMKVQQKLTEALAASMEETKASGGAAVIMDVSNGELLAFVSLPSYDPNKIIKGLSRKEYLMLSQSESLPLYNRVISLTQPPGSTFKTLVAISALEEEVIETSTVFNSSGCMDLGGGFQFCEAGKRSLGEVDLYHGISRSSNIYFCNVMLDLGIDDLNTYTDKFGLGQKTGIDLNGEESGIVASKKLKMENEGEIWYAGDSCNAGIGQGATRVTPLQMAAWSATIANGGVYYRPQLLKAKIEGDFQKVIKNEKEIIRNLNLEAENLQAIRDGMHLAVNDPWGSAFPLRNLDSDPAAKTGSAEAFRKVNGEYRKQAHSWVSGFFPYESPRYSFSIYLEHGGWGYKSAEVMKNFLTWYESEYKL